MNPRIPAIQVKRRQGTATEHATRVMATGEITYDSTFATMRVHDGLNAAGYVLVRKELNGSLVLGQFVISADGTTLSSTHPNCNFRIKNGQIQFWDPADGLFRALGVQNGATITGEPTA
jgi:hypothetical protein